RQTKVVHFADGVYSTEISTYERGSIPTSVAGVFRITGNVLRVAKHAGVVSAPAGSSALICDQCGSGGTGGTGGGGGTGGTSGSGGTGGTGGAGDPPLMVTEHTYLHDPAHEARNLIHLPLSTVVKDGAGAVIARTDNAYDEPPLQAS